MFTMFCILCHTECDMEHKLSLLKLHIQIKIQLNGGGGVKVPKYLDASKLTQLAAQTALDDRMKNLTFNGTWKVFKSQVYRFGAEQLGFVKKHLKDSSIFQENKK